MTDYEKYIFDKRKESFFEAISTQKPFVKAYNKRDRAHLYKDITPVLIQPQNTRADAYKSALGPFVIPVLFSDMDDLAFLFTSGQIDRLAKFCETRLNQCYTTHSRSAMEVIINNPSCLLPQYSTETSAKFAEYEIGLEYEMERSQADEV